MKNNSLFLVTEIYYEYNDEIYAPLNTCDSIGGAVALYRSKENAQKAAREKTLEAVKTLNLNCYGYDADEVFQTDLLNELLVQNGMNPVEDEEYGEETDIAFKALVEKALNDKNDTLLNRLLDDVLELNLFVVKEVELGE